MSRKLEVTSKAFCAGCTYETLCIRRRELATHDSGPVLQTYVECEHMPICTALFERTVAAMETEGLDRLQGADGLDDDDLLNSDDWTFCEDATREDMMR